MAAAVPQATDTAGQAAALAFTRGVAALWEQRLGHRLIGVYLIGSLAHGGFSARYSDIDVALIAERALADTELDLLRRDAAFVSPELAAKLSLFWTDRSFSVGRFPPLDRIDYLDHAVTLVERGRIEPPRPSPAEIRAYLGAAPFERWLQEAARLCALERVTPADHKRYLRALLYPARFLYSWETGSMGSNDAAVAFLQGRVPAHELSLINRAVECRNRGDDPDSLFPERSRLTGLVNICRHRIDAERA
jgi:predicted nucleotidyltransferase